MLMIYKALRDGAAESVSHVKSKPTIYKRIGQVLIYPIMLIVSGGLCHLGSVMMEYKAIDMETIGTIFMMFGAGCMLFVMLMIVKLIANLLNYLHDD